MRFIFLFLLLSSVGFSQLDTIFKKEGGIITGTITLINDKSIFYSTKKDPSGFIELRKVDFYTYKSKKQKAVYIEDTIPNTKVFVDGVDINTLNIKYCELLGNNSAALVAPHIGIDYGQGLGFGLRTKIANQSGNVMSFNSVLDALNFMERSGWELVSSNVSGLGSAGIVYYSYLLRRKK